MLAMKILSQLRVIILFQNVQLLVEEEVLGFLFLTTYH